MDERTRKMVGLALVAVGAVIAVVGLLADTLGIGAEGADGMGGKQIALLVVGVLVAAGGAAALFLPLGQKGSVEVTES